LPHYDYSHFLKFDLQYHIDSLEFSLGFEDAVYELMGITAKYLHLLSSEPDSIKEIVSKVECKQYKFTLLVKIKTFKGTKNLNLTIMRL
jgi:hypothetical protein